MAIRIISETASIFDDLTPAERMASAYKGVLAANIELFRNKRRCNQHEFANFMGVSQSMVSKWESGEYNFTIDSICEIAVKMELQLPELLSIKEKPKYTFIPPIKQTQDYIIDFKSLQKQFKGAIPYGA